MKVYRITSKKYSNDFSGAGAAIKGGRWNKKGYRALYTSQHISLSCLEIAVHLVPYIKPPAFDLLELEIPDNSTLTLTAKDLPKNWNTPDGISACTAIGQDWLDANEHLALQVPSSIVKQEYNLILNPLHALFEDVVVTLTEPFNIDQRLLK